MEFGRDQLTRLRQQCGQIVIDEAELLARRVDPNGPGSAAGTLLACLGLFMIVNTFSCQHYRDRGSAGNPANPNQEVSMAERSFVEEVGKLRLGAGEVFRGEGILAVTKALLESGVSYVAGYQGAPISHLMDVLADAAGHPGRARHPFRELGQRGDRGGDARRLGQLSAARRGDVQGAGRRQRRVRRARQPRLGRRDRRRARSSSARTTAKARRSCRSARHAFAMKSQIWLLDPRPNLPSIVAAVKHGFALSEASHTPVMLMLRIRACHVHGRFVAGDNRTPASRPRTRSPRRAATPPHRAAAGDLRARAGKDRRALAGGAALHRGAPAQRGVRGRGRLRRPRHRRPGRQLQRAGARARAARPGRRLRPRRRCRSTC